MKKENIYLRTKWTVQQPRHTNQSSVYWKWCGWLVLLGCVGLLEPARQTYASSTGPVSASVEPTRLFRCFPTGLRAKRKKKKKEKKVSCETSAALYHAGSVLLGNDKTVPGVGRSSVFFVKYKKKARQLARKVSAYLTKGALVQALKLEDFSLSPDRRYAFATTGFDRIRPDGRWDRYNQLIYWPTQRPEVARVFQASLRDPKTQKIPLREWIQVALKNAEFPNKIPYFKVEGLAAIPGNRLLLGVREAGAHYKHFRFMIKILSLSYREENGVLILNEGCQVVYDFSLRARRYVPQVIGLSGLEYDTYHQRLYLLTSFELNHTCKGLGAYLWTLSLSALADNRPATLIRTPAGQPLLFTHKAEAVTVIDRSTLLIVHDDDRVKGCLDGKIAPAGRGRKLHQAAYTIVRWHR